MRKPPSETQDSLRPTLLKKKLTRCSFGWQGSNSKTEPSAYVLGVVYFYFSFRVALRVVLTSCPDKHDTSHDHLVNFFIRRVVRCGSPLQKLRIPFGQPS